MEYLKEEDVIFCRGDEGQLLPVDLVLKSLEKKTFETVKEEINGKVIESKKVVIVKEAPKISFLPITRGKWLEIIKKEPKEQDLTICGEHILKPKITKEMYEVASRPPIIGAIITAVTAFTLGLSQEEIKLENKEEITEAKEFEIKKNS